MPIVSLGLYVCRCGCYDKLTNYGTRIMYMEYLDCVGTISLFQIAIEVVNSNSGLWAIKWFMSIG